MTAPLDPAALARLRKLKAAATPPVWHNSFNPSANDEAFIVALVNNADALLSAAEEVVRLRRAVEEWAAAHREFTSQDYDADLDVKFLATEARLLSALSPHEGSAG